MCKHPAAKSIGFIVSLSLVLACACLLAGTPGATTSAKTPAESTLWRALNCVPDESFGKARLSDILRSIPDSNEVEIELSYARKGLKELGLPTSTSVVITYRFERGYLRSIRVLLLFAS
jgi:hypothetical protein